LHLQARLVANKKGPEKVLFYFSKEMKIFIKNSLADATSGQENSLIPVRKEQ